MKTIFVTGTNGLLGTNLINLLLRNDYSINGLVRHVNSYKGIKNRNLQLITGTLFDDFTNVLKDVDYIVHIAAVTSQSSIDYTNYWRINSFATQKLFQAALKCGVKKFVFVSTANTCGYGSIDSPGTEDQKIKAPFNNSIYAQSKMTAEYYLLKNKGLMDTVIINPTFMLGAYDTKPSSGKIILMSWNKKLIFYPPGGKNFVHVEDVATGILNALEKGQDGEKYLISNENLSYRDFFEKVNTLSRHKPIMIKIPALILKGLGLIGDFLRYMKIETSLSSVNMRILGINNYYSNQKSKRELGISYQTIDKAISDAINYFSNHNNKYQ